MSNNTSRLFTANRVLLKSLLEQAGKYLSNLWPINALCCGLTSCRWTSGATGPGNVERIGSVHPSILFHLPPPPPPPPWKKGLHFAVDTFKCISVNESFCNFIGISLKFVPKGPIDNKPALLQLMAWRRIGDKPFSEAMLTRFADAYVRQ